MSSLIDLSVAGLLASAATLGARALTGWLRAARGDRAVGAKLEEHRDHLTFELLDAAREEVTAVRKDMAEYRQMNTRVAHMEEALDHLHALLHADGDSERQAAERRARAFLRRMRPDIGELRNSVQKVASANNIIADIERGDGA